MRVEDPEWMQLSREDDVEAFQRDLSSFIRDEGEPQIVLIVLDNDKLYPAYKNICYSLNVIS
jgi:hypothetical protein